METKELKIQVPEGYEIDKENSTFENIVFKKKEEKKWRDNEYKRISGYSILPNSNIAHYSALSNIFKNYNIFATEKQAKSALAMARISQIMANDKRFGGPVTDKEWENINTFKYVIVRDNNTIFCTSFFQRYWLLAFHTLEQRDLFLKENEDLVRDYLMIDSLKES